MLRKCYCGPVGKYLGHMLYELFAPKGLSSCKSAPKCTFAKCSRLCAVCLPIHIDSISWHSGVSPFYMCSAGLPAKGVDQWPVGWV